MSSEPAPLSIDEILARVEGAPKLERTAAAIADEIIEAASDLPDPSVALARLKNRLQGLGVKIRDWTRLVRQRRAERAQAGADACAERRRNDRPRVVINLLEEHEANAIASKAIAALPNLYQRFGELVFVVDAWRRRPGEDESYRATEVRTLPEPVLRDRLSLAVAWEEQRTDPITGARMTLRAHPPDWCVKAVHTARAWTDVPSLNLLANEPVLLRDGAVLAVEGYDANTGILCRPRFDLPPVPERPTQEDARTAAERLLDAVVDFPFESEAQRAGWIAALLTPLARWAFSGQTPLFLFDANQAGSGKGLLLKLIGWIVLGREMDVVVPTENEEEERKRITSKVRGGQPMVLIDNIVKPFGSAAIDILVTTGVWADRLLGTNDSPSVDVWMTVYGSGNQLQFKREDTRRRACVIRVVTNMVHPEERSGFKYSNLQQHVLEHRPALFGAALTVLRAWIQAKRAPESLPGWGGTWGSFDDWDRLVRGAIVYAGLADPIGAKGTANAVEAARDDLGDLVGGLGEAIEGLAADGTKQATVEQVIAALTENDEWRRSDKTIELRFKKLRTAIANWMPYVQGRLPTERQLGTLLGRCKDRPVNTDQGAVRLAVRFVHGKRVWRVEALQDAVAAEPEDDVEREAIQAEANPSATD